MSQKDDDSRSYVSSFKKVTKRCGFIYLYCHSAFYSSESLPPFKISSHNHPSTPLSHPALSYPYPYLLNCRPSTPDLTTSLPDTSDDALPSLYSAVSLLQRLIRGRAEQNRMFEGRAKRKDLIAGDLFRFLKNTENVLNSIQISSYFTLPSVSLNCE